MCRVNTTTHYGWRRALAGKTFSAGGRRSDFKFRGDVPRESPMGASTSEHPSEEDASSLVLPTSESRLLLTCLSRCGGVDCGIWMVWLIVLVLSWSWLVSSSRSLRYVIVIRSEPRQPRGLGSRSAVPKGICDHDHKTKVRLEIAILTN